MSENRVLRAKYLDLSGIKKRENGENCTVGRFIIYTLIIFLRISNQRVLDGRGM
jgi:hypothetical protein